MSWPLGQASEPPEWRELSEQELAQLDDLAPYRNVVGFLGLLVLAKALPDALFAVLRHLAGIRGAERLDYNMLAFDGLLTAVGVALLYTAVVFMQPELPELKVKEEQ